MQHTYLDTAGLNYFKNKIICDVTNGEHIFQTSGIHITRDYYGKTASIVSPHRCDTIIGLYVGCDADITRCSTQAIELKDTGDIKFRGFNSFDVGFETDGVLHLSQKSGAIANYGYISLGINYNSGSVSGGSDVVCGSCDVGCATCDVSGGSCDVVECVRFKSNGINIPSYMEISEDKLLIGQGSSGIYKSIKCYVGGSGTPTPAIDYYPNTQTMVISECGVSVSCATIPLVDGTNPGLMSTLQYFRLCHVLTSDNIDTALNNNSNAPLANRVITSNINTLSGNVSGLSATVASHTTSLNTLNGIPSRVTQLETDMGDISTILDAINGTTINS